MKIVIEIPDVLKTKVDNTPDKEAISWADWFDGTLVYAIRNGTVLPEQARIIDMNKLAIAPIDITDLQHDRCLMVYLPEDLDDATILERSVIYESAR